MHIEMEGQGKERQKEKKRSSGRILQGLLFPQGDEGCGKWGYRGGFLLWVGLCDPLLQTKDKNLSQVILIRMIIQGKGHCAKGKG